MKSPLSLLLLLLIGSAAVQAAEAPTPQHLVVAFAPYLPADNRDNLARMTANLVMGSPAGSRVTVVQAATLNTVVDLTVPDAPIRLRQQRLMPQIALLVQSIRGADDPTVGFNVPVVLDHLSQQVRQAGVATTILLLGPALYQNPKEPAFDLSTGWPSDGHLAAGAGRSVFSTVDRAHRLDGINVNWLVTDTKALVNEGHRDGIARFWSLFVGTQGGMLTAFSPDLRNVFAQTTQGRRQPAMNVSLDPQDDQVVMRSRRIEALPQALQTNAAASKPSRGPIKVALPTTAKGNTGLAIVWQTEPGQSSAVDLDLYVQPPAGGPELYFGCTRSPQGHYYRDIRQSLPIQDGNWQALWEFVELEGDQLPPVVWINLYSGRGPIQGQLRLQFRDQQFTRNFSLPPCSGDGGVSRASQDTRAKLPQWVRLDLAALVAQ